MDMDGSRQQQRRRGSPPEASGRPRTVPIAAPEGFWCCPSPAALHKSLLKNPHHHPHAKHAPAPPTHKTPSAPPSRAPSVQTAPSVTDDPAPAVTDDQQHHNHSQATTEAPAPAGGQQEPPQQQHKVCVGFGRPETSDLTVMLYGKEGIVVRMSVHRDVLSQSSAFFAQRLAAAGNPAPAPPPCVEIHDCDDAEIYVETVGLMYCDEAKHRLLLKQSVPRVLRIMKAADALGFHACVTSCLHYLEAVPWDSDEEERSVVSSVRRLQSRDKDDGCNYYGGVVTPLLKRIASDDCLRPPSDTFASITEMVLTSTDDRGRREMKALVLNLLKDSTRSHGVGVTGGDGSPPDVISSAETLYGSCRGCLDRLRELFAEASSSEPDYYCPAVVTRRIALETDNILWLVEMLMLASQRAGDGFVALWSGQAELAASHARVPAPSRHAVSRVTARLFVGVGRGELLPPRDARLRLLQVWLHPLIDDYAWLQRCGGSRPSSASFDRRLVEDGIGQTILTLPLEDQRSILLAWFGRFLKLGDDCPNLQRAFEVWWRRTFVRPYVLRQPDSDAGDVSPAP
ncbi:BTB/POZ domain-containing protein At3g50780-like [Miscanthus floridulus]|uniref:BTB/POZ domain-containing protein At3g50780-like n=1 Tax=Miscanthus floridulus TaxID=154761 RepID=UPI00345A50D9